MASKRLIVTSPGVLGLLLVHAAATWALAGLIWFVQVVHYPLLRGVGADGFAAYHATHSRLTTMVVAPLMLVEAAAALWIAVDRHSPAPAASLGLGLLAIVWAATFFVAVPRHAMLAAGYDGPIIDGLVATNWFRTLAWSARALLASWMLYALARAA